MEGLEALQEATEARKRAIWEAKEVEKSAKVRVLQGHERELDNENSLLEQ